MFEKLKKRSWFSFCPQITTNCVYCLGFFAQIRVSRWSLSHSPPQFQWLIMPLLVAAREKRRDHRDNSREAGKRGVDSPTRSEWCPRFCFQCWDQWAAAAAREDRQRKLVARQKQMFLQNRHAPAAGHLSLKDEAAHFPFFGWNKDGERSLGRQAADVNRIRYSQISILIRSFHCILICVKFFNSMRRSWTLLLLLLIFFFIMSQCCKHVTSWIIFQVTPGNYSR